MKQTIALAFLILSVFTISSCDKQSTTNEAAGMQHPDGLPGRWELRELIGCQVPNCNPYYKKGNGNGWFFTDSSYKYYRDHALVASGRLEFGKDTSMATGRLMDYFFLKDNVNNVYPTYKIFFEIKKDTLYLYRGVVAADGSIEKFVPAQEDF